MRMISQVALLILLSTMATIPASAQQLQQITQRFVQNSASRFINSTISGAMQNSTAGGVGAVAQNLAQASSGGSNQMMLPQVSTSSVDLNTCDMDFIGGKSRPSAGGDDGGSGGSGGVDTSGYPPAPGPGYQPMTQHGQFVGWYSPEEVAMSQTDFPDALVSILKSNRYYGGIEGAASILYEIGKISSPFAFDEAAAFLGQ
ncbi:MAG TPA: hypothetical protein V6C76_18010 [Drouetiella sp.]